MNSTLKTDISAYLSAARNQESLYLEIGADREKAIEQRPNRWAARAKKKEMAENVLLSVIGQEEYSSKKVGLLPLFQSLTSGEGDSFLLCKLADAIAENHLTNSGERAS